MHQIIVAAVWTTAFLTPAFAADNTPKGISSNATKTEPLPNPALDVKAPPKSTESTGVSGTEVPKGQATDPRNKPKEMDPNKQM